MQARWRMRDFLDVCDQPVCAPCPVVHLPGQTLSLAPLPSRQRCCTCNSMVLSGQPPGATDPCYLQLLPPCS